MIRKIFIGVCIVVVCIIIYVQDCYRDGMEEIYGRPEEDYDEEEI